MFCLSARINTLFRVLFCNISIGQCKCVPANQMKVNKKGIKFCRSFDLVLRIFCKNNAINIQCNKHSMPEWSQRQLHVHVNTSVSILGALLGKSNHWNKRKNWLLIESLWVPIFTWASRWRSHSWRMHRYTEYKWIGKLDLSFTSRMHPGLHPGCTWDVVVYF